MKWIFVLPLFPVMVLGQALDRLPRVTFVGTNDIFNVQTNGANTNAGALKQLSGIRAWDLVESLGDFPNFPAGAGGDAGGTNARIAAVGGAATNTTFRNITNNGAITNNGSASFGSTVTVDGIVDTKSSFTNSGIATLNGVTIQGSITSQGAANAFAQDVTFNGPTAFPTLATNMWLRLDGQGRLATGKVDSATIAIAADGTLSSIGGSANAITNAPWTTNLVVGYNLGAAISNLPNNSVANVLPGTHTVTPSIVYSNTTWRWAPITLRDKTNVTINMVGATIDGHAALGEMWYITNCSGITLNGGVWDGLVQTNIATLIPTNATWGLFSYYNVANLRINGTHLKNAHYHGVLDIGAGFDGINSTNNILFDGMLIENVGNRTTNNPISLDGAAIVLSGGTVQNCYIRDCMRGIEFFTAGNAGYNSIARNNALLNILDLGITTSGATNLHGILVQNNRVENQRGYTRRGESYISRLGIWMNGGSKHRIIGNTVIGTNIAGISVGGSYMPFLEISGNRVVDGETGIQTGAASAVGGDHQNLSMMGNVVENALIGYSLFSLRDSFVGFNKFSQSSASFSVGFDVNFTGNVINTNVLLINNSVNDSSGNLYAAYYARAGRRIILNGNDGTNGTDSFIKNDIGSALVFRGQRNNDGELASSEVADLFRAQFNGTADWPLELGAYGDGFGISNVNTSARSWWNPDVTADNWVTPGNIGVADLAYNATTWNGSTNVPTRNAVRDWLEGFQTSINAGVPNGSGTTVHWSQLLGVPAGFADNTDDGGVGGAAALGITSNNVVKVTNVAVLTFTNGSDIIPVIRSNALNQAEVQMTIPTTTGSGHLARSNAPVLGGATLNGSTNLGLAALGITNATGTAVTAVWGGDSWMRLNLSGTTTISFTNCPAAVADRGAAFTLELYASGVAPSVTIQNIDPRPIIFPDGLILNDERTNFVTIRFDGTNFLGSCEQVLTRGSGPFSLSTNAIVERQAHTNVTTDRFPYLAATTGILTNSPYSATDFANLQAATNNINDDLVDFDDADGLWTATRIGPALEEMNDSINAGSPNGAGAKVHWSQLLGVPAGFADNTDDGAGGSPGGSPYQLQYNTNSTFGAVPAFSVDPLNHSLNVSNNSALGGSGLNLWGDSTKYLKFLLANGQNYVRSDDPLTFEIAATSWFTIYTNRLSPAYSNAWSAGEWAAPLQSNVVNRLLVLESLAFTPSAGSGKVLTSDANGVGTWQTPAAGGGTNFDSIIVSNQVFYGENLFIASNAVAAFNFQGATRNVANSNLVSDVTYTLTNPVTGGSLEVYLIGRTNAATNHTVTIVATGGATINWKTSTNGAHAFLLFSNATATLKFKSYVTATSTNIDAEWTQDSFWPQPLSVGYGAAGGSVSNVFYGGLMYYDYSSYTNHDNTGANYTNLASVTIPAHAMTNIGDTLTFLWRGRLKGSVTGTNQLIAGIGLNTNGLGDSGLFRSAANAAWEYRADVTATGPTNQYVFWRFTVGGTNSFTGSMTNFNTSVFTLGILTNGMTNVVYLKHKGTGQGAITNDFFKVSHQAGIR